MKRTIIDIQPFDKELPSHFADRLGVLYAKAVSLEHKKDNGQFFTPTEVAHFMAGLTEQKNKNSKYLTRGAVQLTW